MADKMLRVAGRGVDGTAKPIKTDNEGNISVQLTGSKPEIYIYDNVTLSAGNNSTADIDVSRFSHVSFFIKTDVEHIYILTATPTSMNGSAMITAGKERLQIAKNNLTTKKTGKIPVDSPKLRFFLFNADTAPRTYTLIMYGYN